MSRKQSWFDDDGFEITRESDYLKTVAETYQGRQEEMGLALRQLMVRTGHLPTAARSRDTR